MNTARVHDIAVIGAGAAGLMAAYWAAADGADVVVLESQDRAGRKILISGGGRCNILPVEASEQDFYGFSSSKLVRNALRALPLDQQVAFFEETAGIPLKIEPEFNKRFPESNKASDVVDALVRLVTEAGGTLLTEHKVRSIRQTELFEIDCADAEPVQAKRIILSTGGRSVPKIGTEGAGYSWVRDLGHTVTDLYPALVPLTSEHPICADLSGLSLPATLTVSFESGKVLGRETGPILFTHRGYSGPVVLNASRWVAAPQAEPVYVHAAWLGRDTEEWKSIIQDWGNTPARRNTPLSTLLAQELPRRLAASILNRCSANDVTASTITKDKRKALIQHLGHCPLDVSGTEGYKKAEVTAGGVPLSEVKVATMESRVCPGLHLAGEILDCTGRLGGYNFMWAWASGRIAGQSAARALNES